MLPLPLHYPPRRPRVGDHDALEGAVELLMVAEPEAGVVRPQEVGVVDEVVAARVVAQRAQLEDLDAHSVPVLGVPVVPEAPHELLLAVPAQEADEVAPPPLPLHFVGHVGEVLEPVCRDHLQWRNKQAMA